MKLTPLEIKKQQFEKSLRGYDAAEVKSFLSLVSDEVEQLLTLNKEQEEEIQKLTQRVEHYERVEEALHETLQTAKDSAVIKIEQAKAEAQNRIDKAQLEGDAIILKANTSRQEIQRDILRLLNKKEEIIAGIGSYLENAMLTLNQFSKNDLNRFTLEEEEMEPQIIRNEPEPTTDETETPIKTELSQEEAPKEELTSGDENIDNILDEID